MTLNDNTKRIVFIVLAIILFLSVILPLVAARFEEQKVVLSTGTIKIVRLALSLLTASIAILWLALSFYSDWVHNRIDSIELSLRMKTIITVLWWLTIVILVSLGIKFLIVLYIGSHRIVFASIKFVLLSLCFGFFLLYFRQWLHYFRTHTLQNIVAACLLEQHEKSVKTSDFDKAYSTLLKACEMDPDGFWLWCKLALFCERFRKNSAEADEYMAKVGELIATNKANSINEKASYFDCLGLINYIRGEYQKALDYSKQAINIEPNPERVRLYEQILSELNARKQDT